MDFSVKLEDNKEQTTVKIKMENDDQHEISNYIQPSDMVINPYLESEILAYKPGQVDTNNVENNHIKTEYDYQQEIKTGCTPIIRDTNYMNINTKSDLVVTNESESEFKQSNLDSIITREAINAGNQTLDMFPCDICTATFSTLNPLLAHQRKDHANYNYQKTEKEDVKEEFNIVPDSTTNIKDEMRFSHRKPADEDQNIMPSLYRESNIPLLERESLSVDSDTSLQSKSPNFDKQFNEDPSTKIMMQDKHNQMQNIETTKKVKKAKKTTVGGKYQSNNWTNGINASKMQSAVTPHTCKLCQRQFRYKMQLKIHMGVHLVTEGYKCTECQQHFREKAQLKCHMDIHYDIKRYQCKICQREFRQKGQLKSHMDVHLGVKPFSCMKCQRQFRQKGHLNKHQECLGPFQCDECCSSFKSSRQLKIHRKHTHKS